MKKMRGNKRKGDLKNSGVTLFEVMIALAFFAIIVTPVMRTFVGSIKTNKESREVMVATDVATSIMEGITNKTYTEVIYALEAASSAGGFTKPGKEDGNNAKYALSSINGNYYNEGHVAAGVNDESNYRIGITVPDDFRFTGKLDDQDLASKAITNLHGLVGDGSSIPVNIDDDEAATDKLLYYGFSSDKYSEKIKEAPMVTFMMYSRIQRKNMFFDAIVTFIPRASNVDYLPSYDKNDEYFLYEVTVKVYPYRYDPKQGIWVERFNDSGTRFDGAPAAIMTGGIPNKPLSE